MSCGFECFFLGFPCMSNFSTIKHTVMRACAIPHCIDIGFVYNDRDSADYILRTTAQSEAAKVAEER